VNHRDIEQALVDDVLAGRVSRRSLLKRAAILGLSAPAVAGLLAACGDDDDDDDAPAAPGTTPAPADDDDDEEEDEDEDEDVETPEPDDDDEDDEEAADEPVAGEGQIVVVDGTEPSSLLPPSGTGPFQHPINGMYECLVELDEESQLEATLATSWEVDDSGENWSFHLREGVMFHDGTELTSEAVQATIDNILNPDVNASRRASYTLITDIDTSDDYVAVITTDPPTPDLPFLMTDSSAKIISPSHMADVGPDEYGIESPVGTGPYRFVEWVPNDHITLELYEDYWGDPPQIPTFIFRTIPEVSTRVVVLRTGEADIAFNLPPADVEELEGLPDVTVHATPSLTVHMMEPKVAVGPMSDVRVRRAMNMAIDKDAIIEGIMRGYAEPLLTPGIPGLWGTVEFDPIPYDPEQAQSLMNEAGYGNGFPLNLVYTSGRWAGDDQVVEAIQGFWANHLGIQMSIDRRDQAGFVEALREDPYEYEDLIIMPIRSSFYLDYHLYRMFHTDATHADAAQRSGYSNEEVDRLLDEQRSEFDEDRREELLAEAQRLIWEDQPFIFLFHRVNIWGQRDEIEGFGIHPGNSFIPRQVRRV
jgi:peptide/nickel transport system substrate-binding protein